MIHAIVLVAKRFRHILVLIHANRVGSIRAHLISAHILDVLMLLELVKSILFNSNDCSVLLLLHLAVTHHGHLTEADYVPIALSN